MFGLGTQELLIIMVICLVLFGANKLPQLGAGLGQGISNFKKGIRDLGDEETPEQVALEDSSDGRV